MCNDPSLHMRTIVTCNESTEFGFEAHQDYFQLIIGRGGQGDSRGGSSAHLFLRTPEIVLPRLADILRIGQGAMDGIAQHPDRNQAVRWPPSQPRPHQPQQQSAAPWPDSRARHAQH